MNILRTAGMLAAITLSLPAAAQITFYEHDGFQGRSFTANGNVGDFARAGFNDRASSVEVGRQRWEVCEDARFQGRCMILRPGRYPSLNAMGLNDRISSVRPVGANARYEDNRFAPAPFAAYDARRRGKERIFQADVTSVRAVVGQSEQHCWIEREQVAPERSSANIPGAIAGALIGGIIGHQVGSGRGNDVATAGGAIAGAAVGANAGRDRSYPSYGQNVQRCTTVQNDARPDYWDVTYNFKGREHRVQMASPPGQTITVNGAGEPRV
ncbi:MAG: beta/gamma crystallin-related protein [Usitatibacter sp.]